MISGTLSSSYGKSQIQCPEALKQVRMLTETVMLRRKKGGWGKYKERWGGGRGMVQLAKHLLCKFEN